MLRATVDLTVLAVVMNVLMLPLSVVASPNLVKPEVILLVAIILVML
jgi:hypothetical protein